jgi:hypothetical protein
MLILFVFIYLLAGITIVSLCASIYTAAGKELKIKVRFLMVIIWPLSALQMFVTRG